MKSSQPIMAPSRLNSRVSVLFFFPSYLLPSLCLILYSSTLHLLCLLLLPPFYALTALAALSATLLPLASSAYFSSTLTAVYMSLRISSAARPPPILCATCLHLICRLYRILGTLSLPCRSLCVTRITLTTLCSFFDSSTALLFASLPSVLLSVRMLAEFAFLSVLYSIRFLRQVRATLLLSLALLQVRTLSLCYGLGLSCLATSSDLSVTLSCLTTGSDSLALLRVRSLLPCYGLGPLCYFILPYDEFGSLYYSFLP